LWERSALFLWAVTVAAFCLGASLILGAYFHIENFDTLRDQYIAVDIIILVVFLVFAVFRSLANIKPVSVALIPMERECMWARARQPNGDLHTQINVRFQVTNTKDSALKLSGFRLRRPRVQRKSIITDLLMTRHPSQNVYGSEFPIPAHGLSYATLTIIVVGALGRIGKPMRVVIQVRDQMGAWHKLVCPHVPGMPFHEPPK
jgi:hypothetical protein